MGLKCSIDFTVAFSKSMYFYTRRKYHRLPGISEKAAYYINLMNMVPAELVLLVLHLFI